MKCPSCGGEVQDVNFCRHCGKKLKDVCDCWVKEGPYDCGHEKCPGRSGLALIELRAKKAQNAV